MSVTIPLYPETLFGYYLQLTALALGGWRGPVTGQIVINDPNEYVNLVENARNQTIWIRLGGLESRERVCERLKGPNLYGQDYGILRKVNLLGAKKGDWCTATLNYVERVINSGRPLGGSVSPLMLFRATIYGKSRGIKLGTVEDLAGSTTIDSIGLGLIGGLASYIGNFKLEDQYEYFLIPDGSPDSIDDINGALEAFHGATLGLGSLVDRIRGLATSIKEGLSLDLATYFSTLIHALEARDRSEKLRGLIDRMAFERVLLVRNAIGDRPQIMWISPLTISQIVNEVKIKGAEEVLISLYKLAPKAPDFISKCINLTILYLWSGQPDFLKECTRELAVLSDYTQEDVNMRNIAGNVNRLLSQMGRLAELKSS